MSPRDSQRKRVYQSDWQIQQEFGFKPVGFERQELWLERFISTREFRERYPLIARNGIRYKRKRADAGGATAWWAGNTLSFAPALTDLESAVHELAHLCTWEVYGKPHELPGHGWQFCATYLTLMRMAWGEAVAERCREIFDAKKVKYLPPVEKALSERTPEQIEMAKQRAVKAAGTKARKRGYTLEIEKGIFTGMKGREGSYWQYNVEAYDPDTCEEYVNKDVYGLDTAREVARQACKRHTTGGRSVRVRITAEVTAPWSDDRPEEWKAEGFLLQGVDNAGTLR